MTNPPPMLTYATLTQKAFSAAPWKANLELTVGLQVQTQIPQGHLAWGDAEGDSLVRCERVEDIRLLKVRLSLLVS